jgi:hypothetical protein
LVASTGCVASIPKGFNAGGPQVRRKSRPAARRKKHRPRRTFSYAIATDCHAATGPGSARSLEELLFDEEYTAFVLRLTAEGRVRANLSFPEVIKIAIMFEDACSRLRARWKMPSHALETRIIDYLVQLEVIQAPYSETSATAAS